MTVIENASPRDDLVGPWAAAPSVWDWATGDAWFIRLAGGPIHANRLMRRTRHVQEGESLEWKRGIRITGLPNHQHRLERHGHLPLIVEHYPTGSRRTAAIWPDSDRYR